VSLALAVGLAAIIAFVSGRALPFEARTYAQLDRYQEANRNVDCKRACTIFFGDSITEGWRLELSFPGRNYVNRGIGGQTTSQMLLRFHQDVVSLHPAAVVIMAGINDVALHSPISEVEANYQAMSEISKENGISVYFESVLPVRKSGRKYSTEAISELNHWLQAHCSTSGDSLIDYWPQMADKDMRLLPELSDDGLHPNSKGYSTMTFVFDQKVPAR